MATYDSYNLVIIIFKNYFIILKCVWSVYTWMPVPVVVRGFGSPWTGVIGSCELPDILWEQNSDPLKEQCVLLVAKPSHQPSPVLNSWSSCLSFQCWDYWWASPCLWWRWTPTNPRQARSVQLLRSIHEWVWVNEMWQVVCWEVPGKDFPHF